MKNLNNEPNMSGQVYTITFEDGETKTDCGMFPCYCPDHDRDPYPEGTYLTIKLDVKVPVKLGRVSIQWEEESDEV